MNLTHLTLAHAATLDRTAARLRELALQTRNETALRQLMRETDLVVWLAEQIRADALPEEREPVNAAHDEEPSGI